MFREDVADDQFCPIIIKSNQLGTLETLLTETQKIIGGHYQIQIIDSSIGPITEADISNAASTKAKIIAFDVPCSPPVAKKVEAAGVIVRIHKLIYKFTEDLDELVHDVKLAETKARGESVSKEVIGTASILQTFNVTSTKGKKEATVFGSRIMSGELNTKSKYQVLRNDEILVDGL